MLTLCQHHVKPVQIKEKKRNKKKVNKQQQKKCIHDVTRCIHDVTSPAQSKVKYSKVKYSKQQRKQEKKNVLRLLLTPKGF